MLDLGMTPVEWSQNHRILPLLCLGRANPIRAAVRLASWHERARRMGWEWRAPVNRRAMAEAN